MKSKGNNPTLASLEWGTHLTSGTHVTHVTQGNFRRGNNPTLASLGWGTRLSWRARAYFRV
jgi:hypothetical protein